MMMNPNANVFQPSFAPGVPVTPAKPKPVVVDHVAEKMKALKQDDEQIKIFKEILEEAKEDKKTRGAGPVSIELFAKVEKLTLC